MDLSLAYLAMKLKLKYVLDRVIAYLFFGILVSIMVGFLAMCYAMETFRWGR